MGESIISVSACMVEYLNVVPYLTSLLHGGEQHQHECVRGRVNGWKCTVCSSGTALNIPLV